MGKLLIFGNGKKYNSYVIWGIFSSIGMPLAAYFFIFKDMISRAGRNSQQVWMIFALVIIGILLVSIFEIAYYICLSKTKINVYEKGIEGNGFEKSPFSLNNVKFTYNQIINVDVQSNKAVVIFTTFSKYTFYIENPAKIRDELIKFITMK